jgi:hypothetical protein
MPLIILAESFWCDVTDGMTSATPAPGNISYSDISQVMFNYLPLIVLTMEVYLRVTKL